MLKIVKGLYAGIFVLGGICITILAVMVIFMATGQVPDSKAVTGNELSDSVQQKLVESGIVFENETIEYYYSEGLTSFVDYGNLFTDARVVSYELDPETNDRHIYSANYNDISEFKFEKSEDMLEDSVIEVYEAGEYSFALIVSNEEDGDDKFYNKLNEIWTASLDR